MYIQPNRTKAIVGLLIDRIMKLQEKKYGMSYATGHFE